VRAWLERSRAVGFLGPGPVDDHIVHATGFAAALGAVPAQVLDLGSGGGVPGLVLAETWPATAFVLLDSSKRRTSILAEAVDALGWADRVRVVRARAEVAGRDPTLRGTFDAVVSRSFGPPSATAECAAPFLAHGGRGVVSEPPEDNRRWSDAGMAALGLVIEARHVDGAHFVVLRQVGPCPVRYPRRDGVPFKRPLW
jgi:16S rRNA (guanine527-N7)-methyltransferase